MFFEVCQVTPNGEDEEWLSNIYIADTLEEAEDKALADRGDILLQIYREVESNDPNVMLTAPVSRLFYFNGKTLIG